jgi:hypothetical protein
MKILLLSTLFLISSCTLFPTKGQNRENSGTLSQEAAEFRSQIISDVLYEKLNLI